MCKGFSPEIFLLLSYITSEISIVSNGILYSLHNMIVAQLSFPPLHEQIYEQVFEVKNVFYTRNSTSRSLTGALV